MTQYPGRGIGRLTSDAGAGFALVPVADLAAVSTADPSSFLFDVELLSPDRLVRYLARRAAALFLAKLETLYLAAAVETFPEQSVASVSDEQCGVTVSVIDSTPLTVTLEVDVVAELDAPLEERDGIAFDVPRSSLLAAAHRLREWPSPNGTSAWERQSR